MSSKKTIKRERDDLAERLSSLLCDLTDGLLSKTNYDVRTMVQAVEATFEKHADKARADAWDEGYLRRDNGGDETNPYRATEETP